VRATSAVEVRMFFIDETDDEEAGSSVEEVAEDGGTIG